MPDTQKRTYPVEIASTSSLKLQQSPGKTVRKPAKAAPAPQPRSDEDLIQRLIEFIKGI